jgi:hypothetical protein
MSVEPKQPPTIPGPDDRLTEPPLAPIPGDLQLSDKLKIYGYIGHSTKEYVNLHHALDARCYYRIPMVGIYTCDPCPAEEAGKLKRLYVLQIYAKTPLRHYHTPSVDLTANHLFKAVKFFNDFAESLGDVETPRCPPNCPPDSCKAGVCISATGFPAGNAADLFGLTISSPPK